MPNYPQAGGILLYDELSKAVQAAGTDESVAAIRKMKETPIDDMFAKGTIRKTERFVFDQYLVQVKSPEQSKAPWDYFNVLNTIAGNTDEPAIVPRLRDRQIVHRSMGAPPKSA